MRPCPNCGAVGQPINGNCPRCGVFRTDLAPPAGAPAWTPPQPPDPGGQRQSPAGYPPHAGTQPPFLAAQQFGVPRPMPLGPPAARSPRRVPTRLLMAMVIALIVVAGSISGIIISRNVGGTPAAAASPSPSVLADRCLIGYWNETSYQRTIDLESGDSVTVKGKGAKLAVVPNGQIQMDYPKGKVRYRGSRASDGAGVTLDLDGQARGRLNLYGSGKFGFNYTQPKGTITIYLDGKQVSQDPIQFSEGKEYNTYTCDKDNFVITGKTSQTFTRDGTETPSPFSTN